MGARFLLIAVWSLSIGFSLYPQTASAQLKQNFYANICPNVENIVRDTVQKKFKQTFVTVPATIRLFFHDCFVQGCDASAIIQSTGSNKAEKDHPDNLSLAGDGFDTVIKAKEAVDAVSSCANKVSCADILALATRDVIALSGGPSYAVELGRLDGLSSKASSVEGKLPKPTFNLNQLNSMFAANGLSQTDMVALSGTQRNATPHPPVINDELTELLVTWVPYAGVRTYVQAAHTVGFSHCSRFANRIYNFSRQNPVDPSLEQNYASQLQSMCPKKVDPRIAINMDPNTPRKFDNVYYKNLQQGKGLFTSDQVLFTDTRSKPTVNSWASSSSAFETAFVTAITKLGRVGVKTGKNGNIRRNCAAFN